MWFVLIDYCPQLYCSSIPGTYHTTSRNTLSPTASLSRESRARSLIPGKTIQNRKMSSYRKTMRSGCLFNLTNGGGATIFVKIAVLLVVALVSVPSSQSFTIVPLKECPTTAIMSTSTCTRSFVGPCSCSDRPSRSRSTLLFGERGNSSRKNEEQSEVSSPEAEVTSNQEDSILKESQQQFLEEQSRKGAKKIASMSIEERTQRAMIAEAVEDQMNVLQDELEEKLNMLEKIKSKSTNSDNNDNKEKALEEVKAIAKQIESLQSDYKDLVSGEASSWISDGSFE
jgi:hypothetical protein